MPDRSQKPALVLHIGFPKCGSTSIQSAMIRNQKMLRTRGIVIVDQTFRHPGQGQAKAVAQVELGQILAEADPSEKIAEGLAAISASAIAHGDRVCVISSESLGNAKEFAPLFQPAVELFSDITVLAYVRPQHEWLPSAWKQFGLKAGRTLEDYIAEGMAQRLPNFLNRIERWKEDIEGCQVSVGALRRPALKDGDLITDAFSRLGWPTEGLATDARSANSNFDFDILSVMERAGPVFEGMPLGPLFNYLDQNLPAHARTSGRQPLDVDLQLTIMRHYEKYNRALVRRYMPDLTYEQAFGTEDDLRERDTSDDFETAMARTLSYMLLMMQAQHEEIAELRAQLGKPRQVVTIPRADRAAGPRRP